MLRIRFNVLQIRFNDLQNSFNIFQIRFIVLWSQFIVCRSISMSCGSAFTCCGSASTCCGSATSHPPPACLSRLGTYIVLLKLTEQFQFISCIWLEVPIQIYIVIHGENAVFLYTYSTISISFYLSICTPLSLISLSTGISLSICT